MPTRVDFIPAHLPLAASAILCLAVALIAFRYRRTPGGGPLVALLCASGWWASTYLLELAGTDLPTKQFWLQVKFLGVVWVPVCWFAFALHVSGRGGWLATSRARLLAGIPLLTTVINVGGPLHDFFIREVAVIPGGPYRILALVYGPWFWVHAAYTYTLLTIAAVLIGNGLLRHDTAARRRALLAILVAVSLTALLTWSRVFRLGPWPGLDLPPFAFGPNSLLLLCALAGPGILHLVPITRTDVLDAMPDAILVLDPPGRVTDMNLAARALLGDAARGAIGHPLDGLLPLPPEEPGATLATNAAPPTVILGTGDARRHYDLTRTPIVRRDGPGGQIVTLRDVTERVRAAAQIAYLARHDPLTGLLNRGTFLATLDETLARARQAARPVALLFIDLDGFKRVNDTHGHAAGDWLLAAVAARVQDCLAPGDLLARLGGDEFTLLLAGPPGDAARVARHIEASLARPFASAAGDIRIAASIGGAIFPDDGADAAALLHAADGAMYAAKTAGKDGVRFAAPPGTLATTG